MRRNAFNEAYCHSEAEIFTILDESGLSVDDVYALPIEEEDGELPTYEVLANGEGETVLFVEADSADEVRGFLVAAGIEIQGE